MERSQYRILGRGFTAWFSPPPDAAVVKKNKLRIACGHGDR